MTRPEPEASRSAHRLRQLGHEVEIAPLMRHRALPFADELVNAADGLIVTSQRAVQALPQDRKLRPLFTVGDTTAKRARAAGWSEVRSAGGDWRDLAKLVIHSMPKTARLCHLAGLQVRGSLDTALHDAGLHFDRVAVYEMVPIVRLAEKTVSWLQSAKPVAVLFYSPATAAIWRRLWTDNRNVLAICISSACTTELEKDAWAGIAVASAPNEDALWRCLETSG